jgi:hypothetical protein
MVFFRKYSELGRHKDFISMTRPATVRNVHKDVGLKEGSLQTTPPLTTPLLLQK